MAKVPRALAQRTRDEFYPKASLQLAEVKGLDLTLRQALEFKYITAPMSVQDAQGMLDLLYQPDGSSKGLSMPAEPSQEGVQAGKVVNLASWNDADPPKLAPHEPEPTEVVIVLGSKH